jgi:hypothetical protein
VYLHSDQRDAVVTTEAAAAIISGVNEYQLRSEYRRNQTITKQAIESRSSTTTLADDAAFKKGLRAKERAQFRAVLFVDGHADGDIKVGLSLPSGATARWGPSGGTKIDTSGSLVTQSAVTASDSITFGCGGVDTIRMIELIGEVRTTGTAGDFAITWAQNASHATATRVFGHSHMQLFRT